VRRNNEEQIPVGIDAISFYTSHYMLDLAELAQARQIDAQKFLTGLGQYKMAVPSPGEDIITMGANAAKRVLRDTDIQQVEMLLFATESGIDQSKAAGIYVHELLKLSSRCRVVELKQACYAGTFGLQLVAPFLRENPDKKVLLIASDVARYGLGTPGESSQGCGAVAMLLSANPRLLALESEYGVVTESIMDFWRPYYRDAALVDGKYSSRMYLQMLEKTWGQYQDISGREFADHHYFCYHTPVPRLAEKAHAHLNKLTNAELEEVTNSPKIQLALKYNRIIGNSYTASLYIGLASLLDHASENLENSRVAFYSYGSGCVAEFFSGIIQKNYRQGLDTAYHQQQLQSRQLLSYPEYEEFYRFNYPQDGSHIEIPDYQTGAFRLARLHEHKRIYESTCPR
jgi:hydroxymethylglutaryl-CoA synthase